MFRKLSGSVRSVVVLVLALMFVVSGCGQTQQPKSSDSKPAASQSSAPKVEAKKLNFPEKPITIIVPAAAGGASDLLARAVEKVWTKYCSQPLQVVPKPTAAGVDGANEVAKAKPDGYTLLISYGAGQDMVAPQLQKLPYDSLKDFAPIATLSITSSIIAVPANSPFKTLKDMVEWSKKENKPVTAAVSQAGGTNDIVIRGVAKKAGFNVTGVPYQGGSQALTALVGEQTMIGAGAPAELMPQVKAGKLRLVAVSFPEKDPIVPDVPTFKEQGVDFSSWGALRAVAAPAGTPKEVIDYLAGVFKKISEDPDYKKALGDLMFPNMYKGPEDTAKLYKETYEAYGKIINELGLKK